MKPLPDDLLQLLTLVAVGVIGGAVKYLRGIEQGVKKFTASHLFIAVFTGGFLGMLTMFLCRSAGVDGNLTGFMAGVAGLMGDEAIKLFINRFKRGL
ncbi:phage holin family protein [Marinomonas spartinae]|uniref:phage holin family protein n=1 Tax=Marinomonas spartinae TaxID=1792290 RepID=UPI0018F1DCD3|nr:phage holin family protein [Marinomonas spartinae]MBJ7555404.1 phage holin family protein [Marinomonas spartinae]